MPILFQAGRPAAYDGGPPRPRDLCREYLTTEAEEETMTPVAAIAGPLEVGATVGLPLPGAGTLAAQVAACHGKAVLLEFGDEIPEGSLEKSSVVEMFLNLSWGMYKWLCIVTCAFADGRAEVEILDAPMFIQRRLDPRVGVGVQAEVRPLRSASLGRAHQALVADLSHGGLKLHGARQLRAGDVIEVTMDLSATLIDFVGVISVMGRVLIAYPSADSDEAGRTDAHVCFLDDQPDAIAAVDNFVAQQLRCRWNR